MADVAFSIVGLDEAIAKIGGFAEPVAELGELVGALVVSQTQTRISSEKTSPSGAAWKPNLLGTSILFRSGLLNSSIHYTVSGTAIMVGSNLIYARIHNDGGEIRPKTKKALSFPGRSRKDQRVQGKVTMPQRQYLGLSAANAAELKEEIEGFFLGKLQ